MDLDLAFPLVILALCALYALKRRQPLDNPRRHISEQDCPIIDMPGIGPIRDPRFTRECPNGCGCRGDAAAGLLSQHRGSGSRVLLHGERK